ncbi:InsB [Shigella dysenteriae]|uniref:InsB n=1 Tax=Shigella dysenteriae TaxID=622 RepID=A0A2X2IUP1_SHIDY|nr:InsB [Shigella dysenteriae]
MRTGLRSGVSELQLPCFTAVRAEIALMSGSAFALRTTPSVAEQEGQLIETEATGAPQKHHHTLNQ